MSPLGIDRSSQAARIVANMAVIQRQESLLLDQEVDNIDRWLRGHGMTRADAAETIKVSPSYLNRVLGAQKRHGAKKREPISLPQLREWMRRLGMPLAEVFAAPDQEPAPLTIAGVRQGMFQASVDLNRWATLLAAFEAKELAPEEATRPADPSLVAEGIEGFQREGVRARQERAVAGAKRRAKRVDRSDGVHPPLPESGDHPKGTRRK